MNIDMVYMYSITCMYIPYSIYIHSVHVYIFLVDHWPMTFLLIFHFLYFVVCLLYIENNAKLNGTSQTVCITKKKLWIYGGFRALENKSIKHIVFLCRWPLDVFFFGLFFLHTTKSIIIYWCLRVFGKKALNFLAALRSNV